MRLSRRITGLVPSGDDGWSIYYRARAMQREGRPVTMLTIGDHDIRPDSRVIAAVGESAAAGHTGYTPAEGMRELRAAIASRAGPSVAPSEVAVTSGGQAALFAALNAICDPGESCIVLDPFYATYEQTVRGAAARPIRVACRPEDGFQPDVAAIETALAPDTRGILINTPNNPTGVVYTEEALAGLADLCKRCDLWLISDEVYDTLVWEGRHLSPRDQPGMAERTVVVGSLSKSHGMTGFRVGWAIGPEAMAAALADLAVTTTYGLPGFIQDAAITALDGAPGAEADIRARYGSRRAAALAALETAGAGNGGPVSVVPPDGGMYVLLDVRRTRLSGTAFAERLLEREGIAVMPGESFGDAAAGHLRVALTVPEEVLSDALCRIVTFASTVEPEPA